MRRGRPIDRPAAFGATVLAAALAAGGAAPAAAQERQDCPGLDLADPAGDVSDAWSGAPMPDPAYLDLVGLCILVEGDDLVARFDAASPFEGREGLRATQQVLTLSTQARHGSDVQVVAMLWPPGADPGLAGSWHVAVQGEVAGEAVATIDDHAVDGATFTIPVPLELLLPVDELRVGGMSTAIDWPEAGPPTAVWLDEVPGALLAEAER